MKVVALIPARGRSKGIPRKNLKELCGIPMIGHAILAATTCPAIHEVWVSSDDDEILEYAKTMNARTIKRPKEISTDTSSSEDALIHFSDQVNFDVLVFVQATSPLIQSQFLQDAITEHERDDVDSVVACTRDHGFWWSENRPHYDLSKRKMRQEKGEIMRETGMFFITSRDALLDTKCRLSGRILCYEIPKWASFEVDDTIDFKIVESIMLRRKVFGNE
jgi:N-acylneuraminate cytidylyltransferase